MNENNIVMKTKDYSIFKLMKGNRKPHYSPNTKLAISIQKHGIIQPIVINDKYEIIDGQHRYLAGKGLNMEIPYIIKNGLNLEIIQELNSTQKSWSLNSCIQSGIARELKDYVILEEYIKDYPYIPINIISSLLQGKSQDSIATRNQIKNFNFKVTNKKYANENLIKFKDLMDAMNLNKMPNKYCRALSGFIFESNKYNHARMINKLNKYYETEILKIGKQPSNLKEVGELFQKIYNMNVRKKDKAAIFLVL